MGKLLIILLTKKQIVHVSNERVLLVHIRNTKRNFCLFQQKENNVYNIYVTINVPFFKRDCTLHLFDLRSKHSFVIFHLTFCFMLVSIRVKCEAGQSRIGRLRVILLFLLFVFWTITVDLGQMSVL